MDITLRIEEEGSGRTEDRTIDAEPGEEIAAVLKRADINPQTVLVERDGAIITHRDAVQESDDVLIILDVISGG